MNKKQCKEIAGIIERLDEIYSEIDQLANDEREKFDNMPENLQGSEPASKLEQGAELLEEARDSIESAKQTLETIE